MKNPYFNCCMCDNSDEDREPLSGDDIETQDDREVWQRFINGEGG